MKTITLFFTLLLFIAQSASAQMMSDDRLEYLQTVNPAAYDEYMKTGQMPSLSQPQPAQGGQAVTYNPPAQVQQAGSPTVVELFVFGQFVVFETYKADSKVKDKILAPTTEVSLDFGDLEFGKTDVPKKVKDMISEMQVNLFKYETEFTALNYLVTSGMVFVEKETQMLDNTMVTTYLVKINYAPYL